MPDGSALSPSDVSGKLDMLVELLRDAERLAKELDGEPDCEVVIDRRESERRTAERRGSTTAAGRQRRARQRRERIPVDSEIRECGWAVVKINTWPEVDAARRAT